ncbi:MAG: hypothetical protein D8M58_10845 [Calditrichaeota bacterium]|nr:MAG: hypothetical protein DWQ03_10220 [Calditrichota bacterium]MBL1205889.1 hypothetical protein [Calditrichota bacterium]NOG45717.1 hypothetical protein [Calditrichota bacterium]
MIPIKNNLVKLHKKISTPALLIDEKKRQTNLDVMQRHAEKYSVNLRPHCKTHKSPEFAKQQIALGAKGITVAKLSEAEEMAANGIDDIFIANQIAQSKKLISLKKLHEQINLIVGLDNEQHINILHDEFCKSQKPLQVRIEIDCGYGRCGITPENEYLTNLAKKISQTKWLKLEGLFTHAGHAYASKSKKEITQIAQQEAGQILKAKNILRQNGIEVATISVGSTPTAKDVIKIPGITEARPGNYIFYDGIQQALGVCGFDQCSLFVLSTITSQPAPDRIVCDAGNKALNLDRGAHSQITLDGFGTLVNLDGQIISVSEEHGIIRLDKPIDVPIGSPLLIIPNHACVVANLYDKYHVIDTDANVQRLPISCRGMSQ